MGPGAPSGHAAASPPAALGPSPQTEGRIPVKHDGDPEGSPSLIPTTHPRPGWVRPPEIDSGSQTPEQAESCAARSMNIDDGRRPSSRPRPDLPCDTVNPPPGA